MLQAERIHSAEICCQSVSNDGYEVGWFDSALPKKLSIV